MTLFRGLTIAALMLCLIVVVVGAYVRLSDAGLGCPDWPGCYGQLSVPAEAAPGFERPLEHAKAWKEMNHRYLASTLGVLIVLMALVSKFSRHPDMPRRLPWLLLALVIFQGLLGMWTVTLLLKPLVVTAHLLGGMSTLALLLWLRLSIPAPSPHGSRERVGVKGALPEQPLTLALSPQEGRGEVKLKPRSIRFWSALGLLLVTAQIFLGGWVSSNYAALACPDLPTCHGKMWPELDLKEAFTLWRGLGVNYEYGVLDNRARVTIHHLHRLGALVVSTFLLALGWVLWRYGGVWKRLGAALWAALAVQVMVGLSLVIFQLPLVLAAGHNAGAALLLLTLITLTHFAWRKPA